jgi:hypothetical protein
MFDTFYPFKFLHRKKVQGEPYNMQYRFSFRCKKNQRYFVILDAFDDDFYAIKFYPKALEHSPKKYQVMTANNDAAVRINTCPKIMAHVLQEINPLASFGFTGVRSENEDIEKPSKRYRLYIRVMKQFFSPQNFVHYEYATSNAYFLINRKVKDPKALLGNLSKLLQEYYEF